MPIPLLFFELPPNIPPFFFEVVWLDEVLLFFVLPPNMLSLFFVVVWIDDGLEDEALAIACFLVALAIGFAGLIGLAFTGLVPLNSFFLGDADPIELPPVEILIDDLFTTGLPI